MNNVIYTDNILPRCHNILSPSFISLSHFILPYISSILVTYAYCEVYMHQKALLTALPLKHNVITIDRGKHNQLSAGSSLAMLFLYILEFVISLPNFYWREKRKRWEKKRIVKTSCRNNIFEFSFIRNSIWIEHIYEHNFKLWSATTNAGVILPLQCSSHPHRSDNCNHINYIFS